MYNKIIDPITNKKYSIFSKNGKQLLKQFINLIQSHSWSQKGGVLTLDLNDPINHEPLRNGEQVCKTNEGHYYHCEPLLQWLQNHTTDPLTRNPIQWVRQVPPNLLNQSQVDDNDLGNLLYQAPPPPPLQLPPLPPLQLPQPQPPPLTDELPQLEPFDSVDALDFLPTF